MLTAAVLPLFFYTKITIVDANPVDFNWSQIPINPIEQRHLKSIGIFFDHCYGLVFLFTSKFYLTFTFFKNFK
jgi:hypothetical protein